MLLDVKTRRDFGLFRVQKNKVDSQFSEMSFQAKWLGSIRQSTIPAHSAAGVIYSPELAQFPGDTNEM